MFEGVAAIWAALRGYNSGGVHRAVSDDYANRIFAYMSSAPPQVQIRRGVPASKAMQAAAPFAVAASPSESARTSRPGESLDIFEKARSVGF